MPQALRGVGRIPRSLVCLLVVAACVDTPRSLLSSSTPAPPDIQQACSVATTRCAHCHPIERVIVSRGMGVRKWQLYIEQMRLKPSSGISLNDADIIFRCLRFVEESCTDCKRGRS